MSILVVGSVAFDSVETPFGKKDDILGGSASFFSIASRFFTPVDIVACIGEDFPKRTIALYKERGIGISGLETAKGKTFRWKARYDFDMNAAQTLSTCLNVFQHFAPKIPSLLRTPSTLFLANIDPVLQKRVLAQVRRPRLIGCDTMNFWITTKKKELKSLFRKVDIVFLNDAEARQLSGEVNLLVAARAIRSWGPKVVVIKKGEHGAILVSKDGHFLSPAYLLETVRDPTGAGDTFAGGMMGYLDRAGSLSMPALRKAVVYGTIMASFAVEDFSVNRLLRLKRSEIEKRYRDYRKVTCF